MKCPFSNKNEKVWVRYMESDGKCLIKKGLGCEKNFHDCKKCDKCLEKAEQMFTETFQAN